jgi:tetratricopeptide (TPR) repeat protein
MNLGITYLRMGKLHESLQAYESIAEYNPDPIEYEGGIRDLQELLREHPGEYPFGNFLLGYLLSEEGKYRWAKEKLMLYQASSPPVYWQQRTQQLLADMGE